MFTTIPSNNKGERRYKILLFLYTADPPDENELIQFFELS